LSLSVSLIGQLLLARKFHTQPSIGTMSGSLTFLFSPFSPADLVKPEATIIAFIGENLRIGTHTVDLLTDLDLQLFARAAADDGFRGKAKETMTFFAGGRRIVFVGCGAAPVMPVDLGARAAAAAGYAARIVIVCDLPEGPDLSCEAVAQLALGFRLASYRFDIYRTSRPEPQLPEDRTVTLLTTSVEAAQIAYTRDSAVADGVEFARSLVNEPGNVLTPSEFARRVRTLDAVGVEVEILNEAELERMGFRALLGVGQGSVQESHVAILRWHGAPDRDAPPLAFIGKGVCFDSGGISIKSATDMAEMKGDMAGAACVTGLMLALASRRAPVNVVGAIGLVENMPGGKAQRPGDIVRSLSGQTIEIIDTDYEGRLVLADLLWHVQSTFRPRFMIDLATLTHDIVTGIGRERAGLFSNDDELATRLNLAAIATGELVWRMPMGPNFDEEMDSKIADVRNIDSPFGGACTAANFIQRFVNAVPWVHLDIAGPAYDLPKSAISPSWGTGWGVRLLDRLVRDLEHQHEGTAPRR